MKIPIRWLKEYVQVEDTAEILAEKLTLSGTAIEAIDGSGEQAVLYAEITTNRSDCLSIVGIAKEVAAIYHSKVQLPESTPLKDSSNKLPLTVEITDLIACPGYSAICFEKVTIDDAPQWMTEKLSFMGQPSINNVVDITNFCLFESGQPLHAFDYDKIKGNKIIVRKAKKGETILGINNVLYELDPEILVIADAEKPIAIAGVMGGKETEIRETTTNLLLESARFHPALIRNAAKKLKLATDSSYRFERGIDPNQVLRSSKRAGALIQEVCKANVASSLVIAGSLEDTVKREVSLTKKTLDRVLGENGSLQEAASLMQRVGLTGQTTSNDAIKVLVGSERPDIEIEADLVEEVIRIRGFDRIPTHIPITKHTYDSFIESSDANYRKVLTLKKSLVTQGFWETVTFSLVSSELLKKVNYAENSEKIRISNPISKEQEWLRPSHLPALLDVISHNINRQEKSLKLFDIGSRFADRKEEQVLALALTGYSEYNWETKREASFSYLQGVVENIFMSLNKPIGSWSEDHFDFDADEYAASILDGRKRKLATVSKLCDKVLSRWKITQPVFYAQVSIELALELPERKKQFNDLPKSPAVRRDIAFLIGKEISVDAIKKVIQKNAGDDLVDLALFDEYRGKGIPKEKRSLAFALQYQKQNQTYTDDEITRLQDKVIQALEKSFSIELRK